jgi:hypothetical protein
MLIDLVEPFSRKEGAVDILLIHRVVSTPYCQRLFVFVPFFGNAFWYTKRSRPGLLDCGNPNGFFSMTYSALGAPTGQASAHAPQSMQTSGSITYLPSPSLIAFTGQPSAQAPQEMHSSEILYAIGFYLHV